MTYYTDLRNGYIKNLITKTGRKEYLLAKYFATFISGGIVAAVPMIINFMITAAMLPAIKPLPGMNYVRYNVLLAPLSYYHPLVHFLIFMVIYFVYGGAFACIALAGSYYVKNVFLLSLLPFVVCYAFKILSTINGLSSINITKILSIHISTTTPAAVIGVAAVLIVTGFVLYYRKGIKIDVI